MAINSLLTYIPKTEYYIRNYVVILLVIVRQIPGVCVCRYNFITQSMYVKIPDRYRYTRYVLSSISNDNILWGTSYYYYLYIYICTSAIIIIAQIREPLPVTNHFFFPPFRILLVVYTVVLYIIITEYVGRE